MFTTTKTDPTAWDEGHQYLYSLLWSAFLDLDAYSAGRFEKRFRPYSSDWVVRELLRDRAEVSRIPIGRNDYSRFDRIRTRLTEPYLLLALWNVVPNLFSPNISGQGRFPRARSDRADPARIRELLQPIIRCELGSKLGVELPAFRLEADSRPILPPLPHLGISDTTSQWFAGRRSARVVIDGLIQMPFEKIQLADALDFKSCSLRPYWRPIGAPRQTPIANDIMMKICLPGGSDFDPDKWRTLRVKYSVTAGAFAARVDFDCREVLDGGEARTSVLRDDDRDDPRVDYIPIAPTDLHIESLRGFVTLEKVPGRPGFTRFLAERAVRFESDNHDRFRVETLMFWHVIDMLAFAERYTEIGDSR